MKTKARVSAIIIGVCCIGNCLGQTVTDAAIQVQKLLTDLGPVPVLVDALSIVFSVPQILQARNIRVISSTSPVFGNPTIVSLPTVPAGQTWIWANCSTTAVNYTEQVAFSEARSVTIQVAHGVSNTLGGELDFTYGGGGSGGFGFAGKISGSRQWTDTSTTINTDQKQYTYTGSVSTTSGGLASKNALLVTTRITQQTISIPFTATIVVDADLTRANSNHWATLSQAVPDAAKRTFNISGEVTEVDWANGLSVVSDTPFDPAYCNVQGSPLKKIAVQ